VTLPHVQASGEALQPVAAEAAEAPPGQGNVVEGAVRRGSNPCPPQRNPEESQVEGGVVGQEDGVGAIEPKADRPELDDPTENGVQSGRLPLERDELRVGQR
jgi:hypothetical protein